MRQLVRILPRPLVVLAAEFDDSCSLRREPSKSIPLRGFRRVLDRLKSLFERDGRSNPYWLFDSSYYLDSNPDIRASFWPPLLHFLLYGGFEGRKPHPLFETHWYVARNPDVAASKLNPLQHYARFGQSEGRNPHPLFDARWYLEQYPDAKTAGCDPLLHFVEWGGRQGKQPHPFFDTTWYLSRYPQARESSLDPLTHYLLAGAAAGLSPNRRFSACRHLQRYPGARNSGLAPFVDFVTRLENSALRPDDRCLLNGKPTTTHNDNVSPLTLNGQASGPAPQKHTVASQEIPVLVVYGARDVASLEENLIPALGAQQSAVQFHLHTIHYRDSECLLSSPARTFSQGSLSQVTDWSNDRKGGRLGWGEAVNYLFGCLRPRDCFYLANPASIPMASCMEALLRTYIQSGAAIVEACQWPSEHPKEFDPVTGATPWANGALTLINAQTFQELNGFDPIYFLCNEDVDLSWRVWLRGGHVIYDSSAVCARFAKALSYRSSRFSYRDFLSLRNFLVIAYKFFGENGERTAWQWILRSDVPAEFTRYVHSEYFRMRDQIVPANTDGAFNCDKVKILGLNQYHQLRAVLSHA